MTMTTSTAVQLFNFKSNQIGVVMIDGEPRFVAQEVSVALGVYVRPNGSANTNPALQPLGSGEKIIISYLEAKSFGLQAYTSRAHGLTLMFEAGLYNLIIRAQSSRPSVAAFQDWVTREVLPSIRKTGAYVVGQPAITQQAEDPLGLLRRR